MKYTDQTPIPFGSHEGKAMKEVPAGYLLYLQAEWSKSESSRRTIDRTYPGLIQYLETNKADLETREGTEHDEERKLIEAAMHDE